MKHYIVVKWNSLVKNKKEMLPEIKEIFAKTLEVEGVQNVEIIENVIDRTNRYDLIIRIEMEKASLPLYDACSAHKEWKEKYGKYIENKAIFDSEE